MTDEERQRTMDFILAQQTQFWTSMQKLEESQQMIAARTSLHDHQMDRLERIMKLVIKAGLRARRQMREQNEHSERSFASLREAQAGSDRRLEELRESQAHSDKRLDALIDIVREQRNGKS
jgi:hypothetical protein